MYFTAQVRTVIFACLLATAFAAQAQRIPIALGDDNFNGEGLVKGVSATSEQCASLAGAVWARLPSGEAECIRYWASGLAAGAANSRVLFYIPGDQMSFDTPDAGYASRSPRSMQALADNSQARLGMAFVLLSRPGMLGSSGEHKQRRRELEPRLVSAALDEIKKKHGIEELSLAGLSGGGHTVAALLGWRSDIVCAVPASAASSPKMRWRIMGRDRDVTGFSDSYEPVDHLKAGVFNAKLRVFVLGDPKDSNVMWATQTPLADRLKALGVPVELVNGEGSDAQRHFLGASAQTIGGLCAQGRSTQEILDVAAKGLKG